MAPVKSANKGTSDSVEPMEGRAVTALRDASASVLPLHSGHAWNEPARRVVRGVGSRHHQDSGHIGGSTSGSCQEQRPLHREQHRPGAEAFFPEPGPAWLKVVSDLRTPFGLLVHSTACPLPSSGTPTRFWCPFRLKGFHPERWFQETTTKIAAIYARVSSDQQRDSNTIDSPTEALLAYAGRHGYCVASDMIFEDEGYSGAGLERPGLERVRDLAAEGRIEAFLVLSPEHLSRRHAYQVLIIEELARRGVVTVYLNARSMEIPEERLPAQFQRMIAKYERAQILERCHTGDHMSIGAVARKVVEPAMPTSTGRSRWERSTVWAMLRNPAYKGKAFFGETRQIPCQSVTRPLRLRGGVVTATTGGHEMSENQSGRPLRSRGFLTFQLVTITTTPEKSGGPNVFL